VLLLADNADVAGALGYHDQRPGQKPVGFVFVETSLKNGDKPSVTLSHEVLE